MTKEEQKANLTRLQELFLRDLARMSTLYRNDKLAALTGISASNLSRYKKKPPGIIAMKKFYLGLAGIIDNPFKKTNLNMEDNKENKGSNENKDTKDQQNYKQEEKRSSETEEGQLRYMNWDDPVIMRNELFSMHKKNDDFFRREYSKITSTNQTTANAFDKLAQSNLILTREVEFYRKQTNPGNPNSNSTE